MVRIVQSIVAALRVRLQTFQDWLEGKHGDEERAGRCRDELRSMLHQESALEQNRYDRVDTTQDRCCHAWVLLSGYRYEREFQKFHQYARGGSPMSTG